MLGFSNSNDAKAFARNGIDVVFESQGYYGRRPPFPVLAWLPDFQHRRLPHLFPRFQWLGREARFRRILATRRHILLSSKDARSDAEEFYGPIAGDIHVVPFAVRLEQPADFGAGEEARCRYGLPDRFLFLPNQFWVHKNHRLIVDALGLLGEEAPTIVATGNAKDSRVPDLMEQLHARIDALGVSDKFRILGEIPYADTLALNARADCLINPSQFEGWSTTVEEAKALGTPLLLSDIRVHREQAGNGASYFDPADVGGCAAALHAAALGPARGRRDASEHASNEAAQQEFADRLCEACVAASAE